MDDTVMDDAALEEALRHLGLQLAFPETPDLSERVTVEVAASPRPSAAAGWPFGRTVLAVAAVVLAVMAGLLAVSPRARAIADDLIHLRGVRVENVRHLPPAGTELHLGRVVGLASAARLAGLGHAIAQPEQLGPPDAVYVLGEPGRTVVSLVYRARPGLAAAPGTGAALILSEFRGDGADPLMIKKFVGGGTAIDQVTVNGVQGYWIAGPHVVLFVDPAGATGTDLPRLSGSTVLWAVGGVTYRLESTLDEAGALRVANSVR